MKCLFKSDDSVQALSASFELDGGEVIVLGGISRDIQREIVRNYQGHKSHLDIFSLGEGVQAVEMDAEKVIAFDDGRLPQGFQGLKISEVLQWGASLFEVGDKYKRKLEEILSKSGKSGILSLDYYSSAKSEKAFSWISLFSLKYPYIILSYDLYGMGFNEFKSILLPFKNIAVQQGVSIFILMNSVKGLDRDKKLPVKMVEVKGSGRS